MVSTVARIASLPAMRHSVLRVNDVLAEMSGCHAQRQHLIEPCRRLPLRRLLDELEIEVAVDQRVAESDGADEFVDGDIHVVAVAGIEDDFLRVAFAIADAQVISEGPGHRGLLGVSMARRRPSALSPIRLVSRESRVSSRLALTTQKVATLR